MFLMTKIICARCVNSVRPSLCLSFEQGHLVPFTFMCLVLNGSKTREMRRKERCKKRGETKHNELLCVHVQLSKVTSSLNPQLWEKKAPFLSTLSFRVLSQNNLWNIIVLKKKRSGSPAKALHALSRMCISLSFVSSNKGKKNDGRIKVPFF